MNEELDPRERALKAEGDRMLDAIQQMSGKKSVILGADGQPIAADQPVADGEPAKEGESPKPIREEIRKHNEIRKRREELSKECLELMQGDKELSLCAGQVNASYKLLYWLIQELGTYPGMQPKHVEHLSASFRANALKSGFNVHEVLAQLKTVTIPFLQDKVRFYAEIQRKRNAQVKRIEKKIGKGGIKFPSFSMSSLFPQGIKPGQMMLVYGPKEAVKAALRMTRDINKAEHVWLFDEGNQPGEDRTCTLSWWAGCVIETLRFVEVMSVVDAETALLLVDDTSKLLLATGYPECNDVQKKVEVAARGMAGILSWGYERGVSSILGMYSEDGVEVSPACNVPAIAVSIQEKDGKKFLVIGSDFVEVNPGK